MYEKFPMENLGVGRKYRKLYSEAEVTLQASFFPPSFILLKKFYIFILALGIQYSWAFM